MKPRSTIPTCSRGRGRSAFLFTDVSRRMPESSNSSASSTRKSYFTDICASSPAIHKAINRKVEMSDRNRALTVVLAVVTAVALLITISAGAQTQEPATKAPAKAWSKKTSDGQPDLQGFWSSQTNTPLERDPSCGAKEFWTDDEIAKGIRTCGTPSAGGRGGRGGGVGGQRGRGQRSNGEVDPHYDTAQFGLNLRT